MESKMIDLKGIKLAVFDFDDTLAMHKLKLPDVSDPKAMSTLMFYRQAQEYADRFYDDIMPSIAPEGMQRLTGYFREAGIPMYCISGMRLTLNMDAKVAFLRKHYGDDIKFIGTGTQERKIDTLQLLHRSLGAPYNEPQRVLFVDDNKYIVALAESYGFMAITPKELTHLSVGDTPLFPEEAEA